MSKIINTKEKTITLHTKNTVVNDDFQINFEGESGGGSGLTGFEELTGVAGEDLVANDVVGYFSGDPSVEILTNRSYFDNGNKYFVGSDGGYIYNTADNSLIETRSFPVSGNVIRNSNSPTIDYFYSNDTTNKIITLYKWNGSEYVEVTNLNYSYDTVLVNETKNYIVVITKSTANVQGNIYSINKNDYSVSTINTRTYVYTNKGTGLNYFNDLVEWAYLYSNSGKYSTNIDVISLINNSRLYTVYGFPAQSSNTANKINFAIMFETKYAVCADDYLSLKNEQGNTLFKSYNGNYYFVSASKDFNEVIMKSKSSDTYYIINVANQTVELLDKQFSYYYSSLFVHYKKNGLDYGFSNELNANGYIKVLGWGEQYNKINQTHTSKYQHIGIVKEDCAEGETATVYKVIDY